MIMLRAALILLFCTSMAWSHGTEHEPATPVLREQLEWGIAGDSAAVSRTVGVRMLDTMRFLPDEIEVRLGETVRFVVSNEGRMMHEFVIGTQAENKAHAELMLKYPNMEHEAAYMAHVAPGRDGEVVWHFNRPGEFEFACLIAGHYQAGMIGIIRVVGK
jgi:uncharacterized cupredoxin-like copper-binding protein